jgi:hypothetical protein
MHIITLGTSIMRSDGQYDVVDSVTSSMDASAVVDLKGAKRSATIGLNENGVWQEPWSE